MGNLLISNKQRFDGVSAIDGFKKHAISICQVRQPAHEIFLRRGSHPGRELDDWLQAEHELQKLATQNEINEPINHPTRKDNA